jgi:hypothetical protein
MHLGQNSGTGKILSHYQQSGSCDKFEDFSFEMEEVKDILKVTCSNSLILFQTRKTAAKVTQ